MLASPEKLFREAPPGLERFPGFFAGERKEYLSLVGRQLRSGKIGLRTRLRGGGTVFATAKSDGVRQREVWHGLCPWRPCGSHGKIR